MKQYKDPEDEDTTSSDDIVFESDTPIIKGGQDS